MRYLVLTAMTVLAACSQVPPPSDPPAHELTPTAAPSAAAADGPNCIDVEQPQCDEVLAAAVEQLARASQSFTGPGTVADGPCPSPIPEYFADTTPCWYVTLPLSTGTTPQVVMARRDDDAIAQAGGDLVSGQAILPGTDVGGAPAPCRTAARAYSGTVVAAYFSTFGAIRRLPSYHDNSDTANYSDDDAATICYIDGSIAKSPPPPPSGSPYPSFDRVIFVAVGDIPFFVSAGYRDSVPIQAP